MANTMMPAIPQLCCVLMKSAALGQVLFCQAHLVPYTPNMMLGIGESHHKNMAIKNAHQQPLKKPQMGYRAKAPQFHLERVNELVSSMLAD